MQRLAALEGGGPDVSPDGAHMVFYDKQNTDQPGTLWMALTDGTQLVQLTSKDQLIAGSPVFSPDGTKVVFNGSAPDGFGGDIMVMNADGSEIKTILSCLDGCALPDWGPKPKDDSALSNVRTKGPASEKMNASLQFPVSATKPSRRQTPTIEELVAISR